MSISHKVIGEHIRSAREEKGMTQQEVADQTGLSLVHYGNIERGARPASLEVLAKFCLTLQRPMEYFVAGCLVDIPNPLEPNHSSKQIERIRSMMEGCSEPLLDMLAEIVESVTRYEKE